LPGISEFQHDIAQFVKKFGHLSDSGNDFSAKPWREAPEMALKVVTNFTPIHHEANKKIKFSELPFLARLWLGSAYKRSRRYRLYREQISSLYTYGYGLFRIFFLELGRRFVQRNALASSEQIFFLTIDEVRALAGSQGDPADYATRAAKRQAEMDQARDIIPPETIYGDTPPPVDVRAGQRLPGIATSRGAYTGPAKVICGIDDFSKVTPGDVIVVPYSDVGWSPLFIHAGGVVSESGGMLSHSSIIAREYNIPAVVSVTNATLLIRDYQLISVDGYAGEVLIIDQPVDIVPHPSLI
jgi:pyruvate,water dikinase